MSPCTYFVSFLLYLCYLQISNILEKPKTPKEDCPNQLVLQLGSCAGIMKVIIQFYLGHYVKNFL